LIVEVRGIGIARRIVPDLTTVLDAVQGRAQVLKQLGTRSHQVDRSRVVAEGPGHRVWNVLRGFEDGCAGIVEYTFDLGSL
jgi:hypothetical protein